MPNFDDYFVLHEKKAYREAYAVLREIMESQPRWSNVGDLYVWCADLELTVNDDVNKAGKLLDKAHELGCAHMAPYYRVRGYALWRSGDHDTGIQCLEKSVELDPNVTNLATFGEMLSSDHDKRTIWIWQRVLMQDPNNCSAHIYLGIEAVKSGDRDKALDMVKRAESLSPTLRDLLDIGRLYYEMEQFQDALNVLLEADRGGYEPKGFLYSAIAACYCSMGDYGVAIEYSSSAIDLNFDDDYAKDVLLSCTEEEETRNILDGFVEKYRDTCFAFIILAQKAFKRKDFSEVHGILSKARQLEPSPTEMYYIGRLYQFLRCLEEALDVYIQAKRMGYDAIGNLYGNIACCYLHLQNFDKATQYASKAIQIDFHNDYAKDVLLYCTEKGETCHTLGILLEEHHDTCLASIIHAQEAFRDKDLSKAHKMTSNAELLDPSPAEMYSIAHLWYEFRDLERSLEALLKANKLGYNDKLRLYESIADCYYWLEKYDAAIQYALKIFAMDPDDEYAKDVLYACRKEVWGSEFGDNY
jgi:tetratricopeptide (TPR) repeat protein